MLLKRDDGHTGLPVSSLLVPTSQGLLSTAVRVGGIS